MLLLLVSLFISERKDYRGLNSFDVATTLPLRGLLALLIVSHHLGQNSEIYPLSDFMAGIGAPIVAVFFFISGYGLSISYKAKGAAYLDNFLKKRLGKLLPKFVVLTVVMMIIYHFFSDNSLEIQLIKFIKQGWTPLPNSWFIYAIVYVYISFYICSLCVKDSCRLGISFTVASVLYIWLTCNILHFQDYWYITIICVNLGYFVAYYEEKITVIVENYKMVCYTSLCAVLPVSFIMARLKGGLFTEVWMMSIPLSVYIVVRTLGFFHWKWLQKIGIFSLELYLIHGIPLGIGQHLGLENWSLWLFTYVLTIPSAFALNRVFDVMQKSKRYNTPI